MLVGHFLYNASSHLIKGANNLSGGWVQAVDAVTGESYYYNSKTYETAWDLPADAKEQTPLQKFVMRIGSKLGVAKESMTTLSSSGRMSPTTLKTGCTSLTAARAYVASKVTRVASRVFEWVLAALSPATEDDSGKGSNRGLRKRGNTGGPKLGWMECYTPEG